MPSLFYAGHQASEDGATRTSFEAHKPQGMWSPEHVQELAWSKSIWKSRKLLCIGVIVHLSCVLHVFQCHPCPMLDTKPVKMAQLELLLRPTNPRGCDLQTMFRSLLVQNLYKKAGNYYALGSLYTYAVFCMAFDAIPVLCWTPSQWRWRN